jgi:large subunit ribosomal protein L23
VKNYLEKVYKLPVVDVRSRIAIGKIRREPVAGYVIKDDDYKLAYVTFPKEVKFTFPDVFPEENETKKNLKDDEKSLDQAKDRFKQFCDRNAKRRALPGWFSL